MRILLADNHKLFCDGLRTLLEREADIEVVGEAHDGRAAVRMAEQTVPDLVIMDVSMPELNGMDATRQIRAQRPDVQVLAVSMHADRQYVIGMLSAGASGYVVKESAVGELIQAIRVVRSGGRYLSPEIVGVVVEDLLQRQAPASGSALQKLTAREREVLQLVAEGHTTAEMASRLHVSRKTIESHRKNLMTKLDLRTVAELTKLAVREGLTSLDLAPSAPDDDGRRRP